MVFLCPFMFSGTTFQTIAVLPTGGISKLLGGYLGHLVLPNCWFSVSRHSK